MHFTNIFSLLPCVLSTYHNYFLRCQERSDSWVPDDVKNCSSREILYRGYEKENRDFIRPKLATFIKNGVKPRKAVSFTT